jgi:hypothetical protein
MFPLREKISQGCFGLCSDDRLPGLPSGEGYDKAEDGGSQMKNRLRGHIMLTVTVCFLFSLLSVNGQDKGAVMTNADVVRMVKAGISADTIVKAIRTAPHTFDTSFDALINLKQSGVPDGVLNEMIDARTNAGAPANHIPNSGSSPTTLSNNSGLPLEGIDVTDPAREKRSELKGTKFEGMGVVVTGVKMNSLADKAGLKQDDLIVEIIRPTQEAVRVRRSSDFYRTVGACQPECLLHILYTRASRGVGHLEQHQLNTPAYVLIGTSGLNFEDRRHGLFNGRRSSDGMNFIYPSEGGAIARTLAQFDAEFAAFVNEGYIKPVRTKADCLEAKANEADRERCMQSVDAAAVRQEIASIRGSSHQAMPPTQASARALGGQTSMTIENGTQYTLFVFFSGPASQKLQVAPGQSQTVQLGPGNYEIAAKVSEASVVPFYGQQSLNQNTEYSEHFYISTSIR